MKFILNFLLAYFFVQNLHTSTWVVINTQPDGNGSFLHALNGTNENPGNDTIIFLIPGIAPHVIPLTISASLLINDSLYIDGSTQPENGYTGPCPKIVIDASGVDPSIVYLFRVMASNVSINGVWIKNFMNQNSVAIYINAPKVSIGAPGKKNIFSNLVSSITMDRDSIRISSNYFGCNCDGNAVEANTGDAIISYNTIRQIEITDNLISGNASGIIIGNSTSPSMDISIKGNLIGTDLTGMTALGNTLYGINLVNITNLELGGSGPNEGNIVSGNGWDGCLLVDCSGTVYGNKVGTDITGMALLPNDPLNTQYNTAFNCNGNLDNVNTLLIGGISSGEQNIFIGNDIAFNIADYTGHYTLINNLIGQTLAGLVSPDQAYGIQLVYDSNQVRFEQNYIYGTNAAFYAYDCRNFVSTSNILGLDILGNELPLVNGYSLRNVNSFTIQNNIIRNSSQGIFMRDCNDSYIGLNSIQDCIDPLVMRTGNPGTCHHNQLDRNAFAFNQFTINLFTGTSSAANDDILPPVIEGSTTDSMWGSSLPFSFIDLGYDITLDPMNPQGYSYPFPSIIADASGHWVYHGLVDHPDELTAMQTDVNHNSSGFSLRLITGIANTSENLEKVFPNPATDILIIETTPGELWKNWQIINAFGVLVLEGIISSTTRESINVQSLVPGLYFLKLSAPGKHSLWKWLKQ